jgi:hypothetical protein
MLPARMIQDRRYPIALQERDAFTTRWLMALKTSQADGDSKNVRISIDALAKARGIPANYPPR